MSGLGAPSHMDPAHRQRDTDAQAADPHRGFAHAHGFSNSPCSGKGNSGAQATDSEGRPSQGDIIGE